MFHVKPRYQTNLLKKIHITLMLTLIFQVTYSQKEKDFSVGLGSDLSFGGGYNNFGSSIRISYNILDRIRVVPTYSYYIKKERQKMYSISFDFNYIFPNISTKIFPKLKEEIFIIYPIASFFILNYSNPPIICKSCSIEMNNPGSSYDSKFGFNFGVGAEYKIPTLLPVWRDMSVNFEMKYQTLDGYSRPLVSFGLITDF